MYRDIIVERGSGYVSYHAIFFKDQATLEANFYRDAKRMSHMYEFSKVNFTIFDKSKKFVYLVIDYTNYSIYKFDTVSLPKGEYTPRQVYFFREHMKNPEFLFWFYDEGKIC